MCIICLVAFLFCITAVQCSSSNTSKLIEDSGQSFMERMNKGKTSFVYFGNDVNPTIKQFLDQLEMSADALEDYGISVAKVNCSKEAIASYCTGEKLMTKAYLFRGSEVLRSFDIDTVFDVNAIVSHVLFTVLFNEVRYVHTPSELLVVENTAKQMRDVVVGHIPVLGLPEHRALMEAAFVYGSKYQFVQTTGAPILKHMGVDDLSSSHTRLWFLHCKDVSNQIDRCPCTPMRKPLDTINIHTFLQLMEAPLITETTADPSEVDVIHNHLSVPVLYLFSQPQTKHLDRVTAQTVALQLRGEVGVVLVHRDSANVKTPLQYNAAYQLPQEDVKYITVNSAEEIVKHFKEELVQENKMIEDEEENEEHWSDLDILDDEVSESVYRDRDLMLDLESVTELTSDSFQSAVTQNEITVVLFYYKWDAVCMAFMHTYIEVADALEGVNGLVLAAVDCGEWTDVCGDQNVTSFPIIMIYRPIEAPRVYRGMLGTNSLQKFILLSLISGPVSLSSSAEVLSFFEGDLYRKHADLSSIRVLGLFTSVQDAGVAAFEEAAKLLRGETIIGIFAHKEAEKWVEGLSVNLPALLVSRGPQVSREAYYLPSSSAKDLVSFIQRAVLDPFPELTVENLPWHLQLGKPLLLLFVGKYRNTESTTSLAEMKHLLSSGQLHSFLPCWIHLSRTPIGRSVLEKFFGFVPPLPALVISQLGAGGEVFLFPTGRPLKAENILQWLRAVEKRDEHPAGVIPDKEWGPSVPFYDFLAIMDQEAPGYASQRGPKMKTGSKESHREQKDKSSNQRQTTHSSSSPHKPHKHSEL
ncbi:thioredoxin domain-containing protein 16 [Misgurnus anguillicaudatus]|uniref:thioredoxin domain-containing protein 16 n=1 Tax=Misgurnus anguillicaudatus TaxID=75329 RepID=UPI003CCF5509